MNLLLIGAGQLGSRHLQSCLKYEQSLNIYVVDNSEASLKLSEERALEINNNADHKIHYVTNLNKIEESTFDYLIIATGASVRFKILEDVLNLFSVKYAILEKVLFQDLQSYTDAKQLIKNNGVTTFVNCPLRVYPFFKEIKDKYISRKNKTSLKYLGGEWIGLACNSIHYIDLLSFLSDEQLQNIDISHLDDGYVDSKRPGNIEFTGTIEATYVSGANLSIEAIKGSGQDSTIQIINGDFRILIDEISGKYKVYDKEELVEDSDYNIIYQSDLTHLMLNQISKMGGCELISFDDSVELHTEFITKLLEHYNKLSDNATLILPVT
jgi:hypothetical protein